MNLKEMRSELAFRMGVREGEADQDFQTSRLNKALNHAYVDVVKDGKAHGRAENFLQIETMTWPANTLTLSFPAGLEKKRVYDIYDLTSGEPGTKLKEGREYFRKDRNTLQWFGTVGPGSDLTLRVRFELSAEKLEVDDQEPLLVPDENCDYIYLKAACMLRSLADDFVPGDWKEELLQARTEYIAYAASPKPETTLATAVSSLYQEDASLEG